MLEMYFFGTSAKKKEKAKVSFLRDWISIYALKAVRKF